MIENDQRWQVLLSISSFSFPNSEKIFEKLIFILLQNMLLGISKSFLHWNQSAFDAWKESCFAVDCPKPEKYVATHAL